MNVLENPKIQNINALAPRSTVKPKGRITMLNGEYDFRYDGGEWAKIDVPSMWQYRGYGIPRYTNTDYPFPFNPPYVGNHNHMGEYKRKFNLNPTEKTVIHFDGVDSCYFVFVNGHEVGMAKGSRNAHEFDITPYVKNGENELYVKVYQYSSGSYLECQDMLLASGIFRDVYLISLDSVYVWDYTVKTDMTKIEVSVECDLTKDWHIEISADGQTKSGKSAVFEVQNPKLWNAEEPYLYEVEILLYYKDEIRERHTKKVGLREIEIKDGVLCLNNTPIKLKGVNRHEYLPKNGRAIDYETTKKELLFLKEQNVNAIRCSHYPPSPFFCEIANELGFYVADEADLETHGCGVTGDQGFLSKNPEWEDAYLERVKRMYERDKNETCIVIWSVGNECGNGINLVKCAEYLRSCDIKKPILYPQDNGAEPQFTDFRQVGYAPLWAYEQREYETTRLCAKPVVATEFAHAMGNSPGALTKYWDIMYNYPTFAGGFVWEFKNHGFFKDNKYLYGGDFGEANHSLNFNLDGFVFSDGTPKPAINELKYALAPAQCSYENGIRITNTNSFKNIDAVKWSLLEDYTVIKSGECKMNLKPSESFVFTVEPDSLKDGAVYRVNLNFGAYTKQLELPYKAPKKKFLKENFDYELTDDGIKGENFKISFENGLLAYYEVKNDVILEKPMKMSFYRKTTDNDGIRGKNDRLIKTWDNALLRYFEFFCEEKKITKKENEVIFESFGKILPEGKFVGYFAVLEYRVYKDGKILFTMKCEPYGNMPEKLPRAGVMLEIKNKNQKVSWYGRGGHENYSDRKESALFGLYEKNISDMSVEYERPQENGNRCDTYFVNIGNMSISGSDTFEFSVHDYSMDSLIRAEHLGETVKSDSVYIYIDYKNRGLGSASCGPDPEEQYEFYPHSFSFSFMIKRNDGIFENFSFDRKTHKLTEKYIYKKINEVKENFDCRFSEE